MPFIIKKRLVYGGVGNITYSLTEQDKAEIAEKVAEALPKEEWIFTLEDGSTVTKVVCVK